MKWWAILKSSQIVCFVRKILKILEKQCVNIHVFGSWLDEIWGGFWFQAPLRSFQFGNTYGTNMHRQKDWTKNHASENMWCLFSSKQKSGCKALWVSQVMEAKRLGPVLQWPETFIRQTEMRNEYVWITRLRQKDNLSMLDRMMSLSICPQKSQFMALKWYQPINQVKDFAYRVFASTPVRWQESSFAWAIFVWHLFLVSSLRFSGFCSHGLPWHRFLP